MAANVSGSVPSVAQFVKDLAKEVKCEQVPQPFQCLKWESNSIKGSIGDSIQIPVIDMEMLLSTNFMDLELKKLDQACKDSGFFQLINHGVSSSLVEKVTTEIQEFFNMPSEEKQKLWHREGELDGFRQDVAGSVDWADVFYLTTLPVHRGKPNIFNNIPNPFRDTVEAYSIEVKKLAMKILTILTKALKVEAEEIMGLFEEGTQAIRMNCYPPCPQPELVMGLKPHTDAGGLTIVLQLNQVDGLELKKDGVWVPVKGLPNAFLVNVGNSLEIVTNGIYRSIEHRATVNPAKERISIATFHSPKMDGILEPAPSLITEDTPMAFNSITVEDYYRAYLSRGRQGGRSFLEDLRINKRT